MGSSAGQLVIAVIGVGGVGKSSLTIQFTRGKFVSTYEPTIEDTYRKHCEVDGISVVLQITDTAGQEEYKTLRDTYLKTAEGILIVYSITSRSSFDVLSELKNQVMRIHENDTTMTWFPMVVVGTKKDLVDSRVVFTEEGQKKTQDWEIPFFEVSNKEQEDVKGPFLELARQILRYDKVMCYVEKQR